MIELEHIAKAFGGNHALRDISFRAEKGEKIAVVGRNGAGKTTLLRILATFFPATSGYGCMAGYDLFYEADMIRPLIGYLPEKVSICQDMTVVEYLKFRGHLRRMNNEYLRRRLHEVLSFCDIGQYRNIAIKKLSHGIQHRIGLADCILHEPAIMLLDDPFSVSDPYQVEKNIELFSSGEIIENRIMIFATHNIDSISKIASRVIFMDHGCVCKDTMDISLFRKSGLADIFTSWVHEMRKEMGEQAL